MMSKTYPDINDARGLPNRYYIDEPSLLEEKQALFFNQWVALAFMEDVPQKGSAMPIDFLGVPLLLLRDHDDEIQVFQNVCRHRGMMLVSEPCKLDKLLRCPYHSWSYDLKGNLIRTPHFGGANIHDDKGFDRKDFPLISVKSHCFMGMVFINLAGNAPDFAMATQELQTRWQEFMDKPLYSGGASTQFSMELKADWKLAVENYCESYHLPFIHPELNRYSKIEDHYTILAENGSFSGQGTYVYNPTLQDGERKFTDFTHLSSKWDSGAEYIALYPNVLLGVHRDHFFAIILTPKGRDRVEERFQLFYADKATLAPEWEGLKAMHKAQWRSVFLEDIQVVEGMQRGRHAPDFDGGKLSPTLDGGTYLFHKWVAEQMGIAA